MPRRARTPTERVRSLEEKRARRLPEAAAADAGVAAWLIGISVYGVVMVKKMTVKKESGRGFFSCGVG